MALHSCRGDVILYICVACIVTIFSCDGALGDCMLNQENGNGSLHFLPPDEKCCQELDCDLYHDKSFCISCKAENFCSVTWSKDGSTDYPFNLDGQLILSEKDTMMIFSVQSDSPDFTGDYSCTVSNGTYSINKTFHVTLHEDIPYTGPPKEAETPGCSNQQVGLGQNATFHCKFNAEEKTEELEFSWWKNEGEDSKEEKWVSVHNLNISGTTYEIGVDDFKPVEKGSTVESDAGSSLMIYNVTTGAYGQYKMVAFIPSTNRSWHTDSLLLSPVPGPSDITLIILSAVFGTFVLVLLVAVLWQAVHLEVKLFIKDRFGAIEEKGQRSHDAFIAYDSSSEEDRAFVLEFIRPKLMQNNYAVYVKDIDTNVGTSLAEEVLEAMEVSLRCIILVSSSFISSRLMGLQVNAAEDQMSEQKMKVIPILFGDVDEKKLKRVEGLSRLMSVLRCIRYKEGKTSKSKFIKRLLLRMPTRSKRAPVQDMLLHSTNDTTLLTPHIDI